MALLRNAFLLLIILGLIENCQRPLFGGDDADPPDGAPAAWDSLAFTSERPLLALHASPFELMALSENQFFRFDANDQLVEQRPLSMASGHLGVPVISDNTFVRLTTDPGANHFIEFRLTRNPMEMVRVPIDSLRGPGESYLEVEFLARSLGRFSDDGTLFVLPVKSFPAKRYVLFLFEIRHNAAHDAFEWVKVVDRFQLDLDTDFANLINVRFLEGNFYITSQEGAWRLRPDGQLTKLFPQWMIDFFSWKGALYVTGLNTFDLHRSTDNGKSWVRLNQNTVLQFVETPGDSLLNQQVLGHPWTLPTNDWTSTRSIHWPKVPAVQNPISFYGVAWRKGKFYFTIDRKIYFTEELKSN